MNTISNKTLKKANEEAAYNLYMYLAHKTTPAENETLQSIVQGLELTLKNQKPGAWSVRDMYRLRILKNALDTHEIVAGSKIGNLTRLKGGLTACTFTKPGGGVSFVFRGTGSGEWIDNGEGLSGIPGENTYITYGRDDREVYLKTVQNDYATDQQVEALNWFYSITAQNRFNNISEITVSGHSKGGNKAQFVAIHSDLVKECYSFDGQGFSPEALAALKKQYRAEYDKRRQNIRSFSAENDYVNVLGERLVPEKNIYYFKSRLGVHYIESILDNEGRLRPMCEQGKLSKYVESVSRDIMNLPPFLRQYAALGVMNIFQKYIGDGSTVGGDTVSAEKTVAGIAIAVGALLNRLGKENNVDFTDF